MKIQKGNFIKQENPFYAGVVIRPATLRRIEGYLVSGHPPFEKAEMFIIKEDAILWVKNYK